MISRFWWQRFGLLVAMIPFGLATIQLAKLPGRLNSHSFSPDGKLVSTSYANDRDQIDFTIRLLSLETGKTTSLVANYAWFIGDECFVHAGFSRPTRRIFKLDRNSFRFREVANVTTGAKYVHYTPPGFVAWIDGRMLTVTDVRTGATVSSAVEGSSESRFDVQGISFAATATRWLVSEYSNGTGGRKHQTLFALDDGELRRLATWTAAASPGSGRRGDHIYSLTTNFDLEIRRALDGSLVETQPLQSELGVTTGTKLSHYYVVPDDLLAVNFAPNQERVYDMRTRQVVFHSTGAERLDDARDGFACVRTNRTVEVLRLADKVSWKKFHFGQEPRGAKLRGDGRLAVLLEDESVHIYDLASGARVRSFRDRSWVLPTISVLLVGIAVWCGVWAKHSLRFNVHPAWDLVTFHAIFLGGLLARAMLFLGDRNPYRSIFPLGTESAFVFGEGLLASWLILATGWFVFGHGRWSIRATAPLFVSAAAVLIVAAMYRGEPIATVSLLWAIAVMTLVVGIGFALVRRQLGWRIVHNSALPTRLATPGTAVRLPLRDLFLMMAAFAALSAVIQFVPFAPLTMRQILRLAIMGSITGVAAVGVCLSALSNSKWFWNAGAAAVAALVATSVPSFVFRFWLNWETWLEVLRMTSALSLSIWLSCGLFRSRGWRLVRLVNRRGASTE